MREAPLDSAEVLLAVSHGGAGAVATFIGIVRDNNEGHPVTLLEYEAYVPMAEKEMRAIAAELMAKLPELRLAALHRVGTLTIGDAAVVCAASAPHRKEAIESCHAFIDAIKARVPIWKREFGPNGAVWLNWTDARCHRHG